MKKSDIGDNDFYVHRSIVRKVEKDNVKNDHRARRIPITNRIRAILDEVMGRTDSDYVFAQKDGTPYLREGFVEAVWQPALKAAEVEYRRPYSLRHTFAAWCLLLDIDKNNLVGLMGHTSKQMIYEVYGKYVTGLEEDRQAVQAFMGDDLLSQKQNPSPPTNLSMVKVLVKEIGHHTGSSCYYYKKVAER